MGESKPVEFHLNSLQDSFKKQQYFSFAQSSVWSGVGEGSRLGRLKEIIAPLSGIIAVLITGFKADELIFVFSL